MWILQVGLFFIITQTGLCQLPAGEAECATADRCFAYEEHSWAAWFIWFCVSLFLVLILSFGVICCLQSWWKGRKRFPQRTLAVFALSDADSGDKSDAPLGPGGPPTQPRLHLLPEAVGSSNLSMNGVASDDGPPSYQETMWQGSPRRWCDAAGSEREMGQS